MIRIITAAHSLDPGPALDRLVAQQVLDWESDPISREHCPPYSTDLATAWRVVEALQGQGWHYEFWDAADGQACVRFVTGAAWWHDPDRSYVRRAPTLPAAICLGALATVAEAPPADPGEPHA